jgi:hypothetical protein
MSAHKGLQILSLQPRPLSTHVARAQRDGHTFTAISRLWRSEDIPRCQLCPTCTAGPRGMCLVLVASNVANEDAPLFSFGVERRARRTGT